MLDFTDFKALYTLDGVDTDSAIPGIGNITRIGATFTSPAVNLYSQALFLDSVDDRATLPNSTGIDISAKAFSIGGWFEFTSAGTLDMMIACGSATAARNSYFNVTFRREADGSVFFVVGRTGAWSATSNTAGGFLSSASTPYHVVATYDGSRTLGGLKVYIGGVDRALTTGGGFGSEAFALDEWVIGSDITATVDPMGGKANQVFIADKVFSADEIAWLATGQLISNGGADTSPAKTPITQPLPFPYSLPHYRTDKTRIIDRS